jgi:hypothetical protein
VIVISDASQTSNSGSTRFGFGFGSGSALTALTPASAVVVRSCPEIPSRDRREGDDVESVVAEATAGAGAGAAGWVGVSAGSSILIPGSDIEVGV